MEGVSNLYPMYAFRVRTGACTTLERVYKLKLTRHHGFSEAPSRDHPPGHALTSQMLHLLSPLPDFYCERDSPTQFERDTV